MPVKHVVNGVTVFVCCDGCDEVIHESPDEVLKKVAKLKEKK